MDNNLESMNLPDGHEYTQFVTSKEGSSITCMMNCDQLKSKDDIVNWVKNYGSKTYIEWRVAQTFPNLKQKKCLFKIKYRCQHSSTWYKKKISQRKSKSTKCPAELIITRVRRAGNSESTQICLKHTHNHDTGTTAASLGYRDVSIETKEKIIALFENDHSPASAYRILQNDAMNECSDYYYKAAADRKHLPDKMYFYNLYYKEFRKNNGLFGDGDLGDEEETLSSCEEGEITHHMANHEERNSTREESNENPQNEEEINITEELKNIFIEIIDRMGNCESVERKRAAETFCKNYSKFCRDDHGLLLAMTTFGKCSGHKKLALSCKTGVETTAIARRKVSLKGKRCLASGRPCKSAIRDELEHSYSAFKSVPVNRKLQIMEDVN